MENIEIAARLEELADLLEISGANPFRIRAYRNAVRTVRGLTRRIADMVSAEEDLTELPGVGKDISAHVHELLDTGELSALDEVAEEVPRRLAVLTRLSGLGAKKIQKLWKELDVTTVDELEAAVEQGSVAGLDGFGERSAEKILRAIEDFRKHHGRFLKDEAVQYLRPLLEHMRSVPGLDRIEVAGSYRRGKETVGDIDLLAVVEGDRSAVMDRFTDFEGVERVVGAGPTRGSVVLRSGLSVDLRILPAESYGAGLHYFTGSKEHNVEMRSLARRKGLRISEYGVFEAGGETAGGSTEEDGDSSDGDGGDPGSDQGRRIAGATEEEIFESVGLPWIPPQLRQGRGEIGAAAAGTLPKLIELADIRGDLHMHSNWSDGKASIEAMARACVQRGYTYMAITDHSQAVTVANGLTPDRIREQAAEVSKVRETVDGIRILHGCEVDILKDGSLDMPDDVLEELDIVLIAVHSHFALDRVAQTERIVRAIRHPAVNVLVHPTGRLINRRKPYDVDVEAVLAAALEAEVAVELNANPRRLDLRDRYLHRARELGVRIVIDTDAHRTEQLDFMETGLDQARRGWLEARDVLNTRPADGFLEWLDRPRS